MKPQPQTPSSAESLADREIVQTRTFRAPPSLVFDAFTDEKHLAHWWGPRGYTITTKAADIRPGGRWSFVMHGPDGTDFDSRIDYVELVRPSRLVWVYGSDIDDDPERFDVEVSIEALEDGQTRLTMRSVLPTAEQKKTVVAFGAVELGQQTLDKLAEHLQHMEPRAESINRTLPS